VAEFSSHVMEIGAIHGLDSIVWNCVCTHAYTAEWSIFWFFLYSKLEKKEKKAGRFFP